MRDRRMRMETVLVISFSLIALLSVLLIGRYASEELLKWLAVLVGAVWVISRAL